MDASLTEKEKVKKAKEAEAELRRSFYPKSIVAKRNIDAYEADAAKEVEAHMRNRDFQWKTEEEARIAKEREDARIAKEREDARIARIKAEMKAKEDEETKKWWEGRTGVSEFSLGTQGGGRNGKKKSKRMIKIKNAKNKSKSKSQSRRQRQKRRRHSRRV